MCLYREWLGKFHSEYAFKNKNFEYSLRPDYFHLKLLVDGAAGEGGLSPRFCRGGQTGQRQEAWPPGAALLLNARGTLAVSLDLSAPVSSSLCLFLSGFPARQLLVLTNSAQTNTSSDKPSWFLKVTPRTESKVLTSIKQPCSLCCSHRENSTGWSQRSPQL